MIRSQKARKSEDLTKEKEEILKDFSLVVVVVAVRLYFGFLKKEK